jgi:hypothetical protein
LVSPSCIRFARVICLQFKSLPLPRATRILKTLGGYLRTVGTCLMNEMILEHSEKEKRKPSLVVIIAVLCVMQLLTACCCIIGYVRDLGQESKRLVALNWDDPFVAERAKQFNLPQVIQQYDQVIIAIESYYEDNGVYPSELSALVPEYLPEVPGIYIRKGERLTYSPEPWSEGLTPFTFHTSGHYPGLAFMHGWMLYYCPEEFEGCNDPGDRHYRQFRINSRWIWINRSAL